ncbi:MAG: alpha/beta hydrolase [Alphaproteobacteria bacterium]|nr:alpha/beta hydrolase [Alphaproteobacteria bacterium]
MPIGVIESSLNARGMRIAFQRSEGAGPTLVWICGFRSDMGGTKAAWLHARADAADRAFLRFDVTGCGRSGGAFEDGTIGVWLADALHVIDTVSEGPLLLIGSSMGGWLALLAARARPERVKGLMLIAPAPDLTERLMWPEMTDAARKDVLEKGVWLRPSAYDDTPTPITRALIEDGRHHLLMAAAIPFTGPVRIVHGQADPDVPWVLSLELAERLASEDVRLTFVKNGDHRLSTPRDLDLLGAVLDDLCRDLS